MHPAGDTTHSSSAHQAVQRQVYSRTSAQRPCAAQLLRRGGWLLSLQAMQAEQGEPRGEPGAGASINLHDLHSVPHPTALSFAALATSALSRFCVSG
eukprot:scaffold68591_cov17-Tisochrysis_lutea.AAC.1